ncbi:unnamed protein product [marine sediment metagenome]|uniref:Uncharacterized protein n=1 Tax=marine sediment metagenome TaxID=412755 RepID=X1PP80_9ZZZZ
MAKNFARQALLKDSVEFLKEYSTGAGSYALKQTTVTLKFSFLTSHFFRL